MTGTEGVSPDWVGKVGIWYLEIREIVRRGSDTTSKVLIAHADPEWVSGDSNPLSKRGA